MTADDTLLDPYHLSSAAWHALLYAVDHLHALRALLREVAWIHMFADFTLVRGALENAAAAVWMLQPPQRPERLTRRLRFAGADIRNGEAAKRLILKPGPRSEEERMSELRAIAARAGLQDNALGKRPGVGYGEIVDLAGAALNADAAKFAPASWRLCSALSHGDLWATLAATERVELPEVLANLPTFQLTANLPMLLYAAVVAVHMAEYGWHLYDLRSMPPY
jgi:hypothetical protein